MRKKFQNIKKNNIFLHSLCRRQI
uniref:Uncharacterized protein n=1 Tax=Anguilla anguilla TaxID=7936 RepID=A0A0E9VRT3_ANGAN